MAKCLLIAAAFLALLPTLHALGPLNGPQAANFWRLGQLRDAKSPRLSARNTSEFQPRWFRQPLDHFYNETGDTWLQRYWVSTRHYKAGSGGPVVVLDGGEVDASV
jgi:hypothetical protein